MGDAAPANGVASKARRRFETVAIGLAIVICWELLARTIFEGSYVLAGPLDVARELRHDWDAYLPSIRATAWVAMWGFVIGNAIAAVLALGVVAVPLLERSVTRVLLAIYCVPMIALAPIVQVLLRNGNQAKIALSALAVVFTTFVATILGLRSTDLTSQELIAVLGGGPLTILRKIRVRSALPSLFAGLRVAAPAALLGATVAEFLGADRGLGVLIVNGLSSLDPTQIWTVAVISTALSGAGYLAVTALDRLVNGWARHVSLRTSPPPTLARGKSSQLLRVALGGTWTVALLLGVWAAAIELSGLDSFFAKGPGDVWALVSEGPRAEADRDLLLGGLWTTLSHAGAGFVLGMTTACLLAALFVLVPGLEKAVLPVAITLRSIPILATIPVVILLVGRGELASTVTVAVMSFFPTLVTVSAGLRAARPEVVELLGVYDCSAFTVLRKARVPAALPALFASARIALPASVLGAVVVEWLATGKGLGNAILAGAFNARYGILWAAAAVLCAVTMMGYALVSAVERVVLTQYAPEQLAP